MTTSTQDRIMRTYNVTLRPFDGGEPVTVEVNLSYALDGFDAIDTNGHEAVNRLRRLAARGNAPVGVDTIERCDWDVAMVRHTLVRVETDTNGKPIRKGR
jgi:hypothetical protein